MKKILIIAMMISLMASPAYPQVFGGGTGGGTSLPANSAGVLTNDGAGNLSWSAAGSGDVVKADETLTWGAGGATIVWTFNTTGTDVTMTWSSQLLKLNSPIQIDSATGMSLSASGVAHGMTDVDATDKYYTQRAVSSSAGGFLERGFSDDGTTPFTIQGYMGSTDPTDTVPAIKIQAFKKGSGTAAAAIGAAETAFEVQNGTTPALTVLGNGTVNIPAGGAYKINGTSIAPTIASIDALWFANDGTCSAGKVRLYGGTCSTASVFTEPATNLPLCRTGAGTSGGCTNLTDAVPANVALGGTYTAGAGTVANTDTIKEAIQKIDGNDAGKLSSTTPELIGEYYDVVGQSPSSTGTTTINAATTGKSTITPSTASQVITLAFSGNPASNKVRYVRVQIIAPASGVQTIVWPTSNFYWIAGTSGVLTALTATKRYEYACEIESTNIYCMVLAEGI